MRELKSNAANPRCLENEGTDGEKAESNAPIREDSTESSAAATIKYTVVAEVADGGRLTVYGRDAWCLKRLVEAGERGCTPIDNPAPRWSGYVFKLRKAGLCIETIHETHRGPFAGTHARYRLHSPVRILEERGVAA